MMFSVPTTSSRVSVLSKRLLMVRKKVMQQDLVPNIPPHRS
jgi:hypothetical protein